MRPRGDGKAQAADGVLAAVSLIEAEFQERAAVETKRRLGFEDGLMRIQVAATGQIFRRPAIFIGFGMPSMAAVTGKSFCEKSAVAFCSGTALVLSLAEGEGIHSRIL